MKCQKFNPLLWSSICVSKLRYETRKPRGHRAVFDISKVSDSVPLSKVVYQLSATEERRMASIETHVYYDADVSSMCLIIKDIPKWDEGDL